MDSHLKEIGAEGGPSYEYKTEKLIIEISYWVPVQKVLDFLLSFQTLHNLIAPAIFGW